MPVTHEELSDPSFWTSPADLQRLVDRPTNSGAKLKYIPTNADDYDAPGAIILDMPSGYLLYRHAHECGRIEVVLRGSLDVGDRTLHAGDVMTAGAYEMYGPHRAGPGGATTAEFFTSFSASWKTIYATPRGPVQVNALAGDLRPADVADWRPGMDAGNAAPEGQAR
jgi:hypothetical protein